MDLDFLDEGVPVEPGNAEIAHKTMISFRQYCNKLRKSPSELTKEEIEQFYAE